MKNKVALTGFWSDALQLPTHYGIKLYYNNPNFEVRIVDFNKPITEEIFNLSKTTSPYVLPISNNFSHINYTFSFRKTNNDDVEIEYELWTPG